MTKEIRMPAVSPTMEEGTLARWLVGEGDKVTAGDVLAEIETDKATMEFEAEDDGIIASLEIPAGTDNVKVGTVIALFADAAAAPESSLGAPFPPLENPASGEPADVIARETGGDVAEAVASVLPAAGAAHDTLPAPPPGREQNRAMPDIPSETIALSSMRKTIARRLTEAKQQIPHIYLSVDVGLDPLLAMRSELNASLEARGMRLSVNDLLVKALASALMEVPECNVQFAGDQMLQFKRADISVAVSIPGGLITPVVAGADQKSAAAISEELKALAARARSGKLAPHEYQGGTASLSNMGMFGIKQFQAVINPPQAMILAIGAGELRQAVVDGVAGVATIMSATGSFDHRVVDGADGARLLGAFKALVENPLRLLA